MLNKHYPFELPMLEYHYEDLEPYIDTETLYIHHDRHFKTYVDNLNAALKPYPTLHKMTLEQILKQPQFLPQEARVAIMRNAGGVCNHYLYFNGFEPPNSRREPDGELGAAVTRTFGSFEKFRDEFSANAKNVFGSGYTFLVRGSRGNLKIVNMRNQESPISEGYTPIVTCDVWEHAYYLKYKNVRADYIEAFWNAVKWP